MILLIIIILILTWIYYLQFYKIKTKESIFIDDLINQQLLKTGDLILFKAYNNFNSIFHGSYFGHVGIVYMQNGIPMIFEANNIDNISLKKHHSKDGIFLTPLIDRIKKYKGKCFLKPIYKQLDKSTHDHFYNFIEFGLQNMKYDHAVFSRGICRYLGIEKCGKGTDCGQLVVLSLINLGLLSEHEYDIPRLHHLKYVSELTDLINNNYMPLIEIIDHPFAE